MGLPLRKGIKKKLTKMSQIKVLEKKNGNFVLDYIKSDQCPFVNELIRFFQ